jgi:hypothetical protein
MQIVLSTVSTQPHPHERSTTSAISKVLCSPLYLLEVSGRGSISLTNFSFRKPNDKHKLHFKTSIIRLCLKSFYVDIKFQINSLTPKNKYLAAYGNI